MHSEKRYKVQYPNLSFLNGSGPSFLLDGFAVLLELSVVSGEVLTALRFFFLARTLHAYGDVARPLELCRGIFVFLIVVGIVVLLLLIISIFLTD